MHETLKQIGDMGIIPVVKIEDPAKALPLAKALKDGGLPCAEITFRTGAAKEAIQNIAKVHPDMLLGAGTVLSAAQADDAVAAGARYIVSPGFNPAVVSHCVKKGIPIIPGCSTPSDMERAIEAGLEAVKFFPAGESGGVNYIKAVSAPFPMLKFIPTGGVSAENLNSYLSLNAVLACGGSWMVKAELINEGRFDEIAALTRKALNTMLGFNLSRLGFNTADGESAGSTAGLWEKFFDFPLRQGDSSVFAGPWFEHLNAPGPGKHGHIVIGTLTIHRAVAWLKRRGYGFRDESAETNSKGELTGMYLKDEIAGFAIRLVQSQ
ncbi:MAG: bifunctional 4-hydroxy-2-oxoglutarate aldolase/2-dehydro-3-deoxy-phosphogluconate aldolase [Spirochaetaceae bacterium]|jgi:2-dehydro-3-deoxyphosphogluconate aldolase/(4S)-4-hydroxy-2-oxoglutarate aldolase|nr:bifunctional 4-hydroxy-2-oxoglutarate aldolase/2-dehydro-3-deoxy-phosphogluconate aldolase [Spirochaetaceae bacterium]